MEATNAAETLTEAEALESRNAIRCIKVGLLLSRLQPSPNRRHNTAIDHHDTTPVRSSLNRSLRIRISFSNLIFFLSIMIWIDDFCDSGEGGGAEERDRRSENGGCEGASEEQEDQALRFVGALSWGCAADLGSFRSLVRDRIRKWSFVSISWLKIWMCSVSCSGFTVWSVVLLIFTVWKGAQFSIGM